MGMLSLHYVTLSRVGVIYSVHSNVEQRGKRCLHLFSFNKINNYLAIPSQLTSKSAKQCIIIISLTYSMLHSDELFNCSISLYWLRRLKS